MRTRLGTFLPPFVGLPDLCPATLNAVARFLPPVRDQRQEAPIMPLRARSKLTLTARRDYRSGVARGAVVIVGGHVGPRPAARRDVRRRAGGTSSSPAGTRSAAPASRRASPGRARSTSRALDLAEPETLASRLAPVGQVRGIVLAAIERDENNLAEYDIARAIRLVTLKLVGYTEVVHALAPRLDARRVDPPLRRPGAPPSLPRLDHGHDRERRRRRPDAHARAAARADPGERDPPRRRRRQPRVGLEAARRCSRRSAARAR